jgi:hypothetical protein
VSSNRAIRLAFSNLTALPFHGSGNTGTHLSSDLTFYSSHVLREPATLIWIVDR